MGLDFFVKLKYQSITIILSVGITCYIWPTLWTANSGDRWKWGTGKAGPEFAGPIFRKMQDRKMQDRKMQNRILKQVRRRSSQQASVSARCWTLRKPRRDLPDGGQQLSRHRRRWRRRRRSASIWRCNGTSGVRRQWYLRSLLDATQTRWRFGSMWTRTLLLALCEHGVCHGQWVSCLQDTHTDGHAPVPVRCYELTRLREMFIVTFNASRCFSQRNWMICSFWASGTRVFCFIISATVVL